MEKYAVIKLASKQYLVHEGDIVKLERQEKPLKIGVLFYFDGDKNFVGEPELKDISVNASILEEKLDKKVRVARFKKKSRYERVRGHRQPISLIKIDYIGLAKEEKSIEKKVDQSKSEKKNEIKVKEKVFENKSAKKPVNKPKEAKKEIKKTSTTKKSSNLKGSK